MAAAASLRARLALVCAETLAPLERGISQGLRGRLGGGVAGTGAAAPPGCGSGGVPRVAVLGRPSAEFAAAVRGARAAGAAVAPLDVRSRGGEELQQLLAEAQVELAVIAGSALGSAEGRLAVEAARSLGASTTTPAALADEGLGAAADSGDRLGPLLLYSAAEGSEEISVRAVEVTPEAVASRVDRGREAWGFSDADVVLPLSVVADHPCAAVDVWEAPLAAGAKVALPSWGQPAASHGPPALPGAGRELAPGARPPLTPPSEMWAAVAEIADATVLVTSARSVRPFLDGFADLAPGLRAELAQRAAERRVRLSVVLCLPGTVPSQELSDRWQELFGCPLTWHFGCAEAGSLFSVGGQGGLESGSCAEGLEWQVDEELGELQVRGPSLFRGYQGRPRSTTEAFDEDGFFLRTGHRVTALGEGAVQPEPAVTDPELDWDVINTLYREPNTPRGNQMPASWKIRKVPMKVWAKWRTRWGAVLLTKKHNQSHTVYEPKYHKNRDKNRKKRKR